MNFGDYHIYVLLLTSILTKLLFPTMKQRLTIETVNDTTKHSVLLGQFRVCDATILYQFVTRKFVTEHSWCQKTKEALASRLSQFK